MKLLIDMNLAPRWVEFLETAGFEASHWSDVGAPSAEDTVILAHARAHGFVLLTNDLDFSAILAASAGATPSIVQLRTTNLSPEQIGNATLSALQNCASDLASGAVVTIDEKKARLRKLPLKN